MGFVSGALIFQAKKSIADDDIYDFQQAISISGWNHIAVCRKSGVLKMYLNGVQIGSFSSGKIYLNTSGARTLKITGNSEYMAEISIHTGIARWTRDFTPPGRMI